MNAALHDPALTTADLLACIPGLPEEQFRQWLARGHIVPTSGEPPGKGRRRMFSPHDVLQTATAWALARQSIYSPAKARMVWNLVNLRLMQLQSPMPGDEEQALLLHINPITGDLDFRPVTASGDDGLEREDAPDVLVLFRTDSFIRRTLGRVEQLLSDAAAPPPEPAQDGDAVADFLLIYEKDARGRKVRTGLTYLETAELEALSAGSPETDEESRRYFELHDKHERARHQRIAAEQLKKSGA
ncbi:hypothetical protein ACI6QG_04055 [Roseococcus sp. DSY-14]|uniref:hypothetical protein n=1 Tax=Roseococcus sp. DSY-14 TaxID=3369650 RepID=UPI00387ADBA1